MPLQSGAETIIDRWFVQNRLIKPPDFTRQVEIFHDLILNWSSRMNLISKNDLNQLLERHILDSLAPLHSIPETGRLLDIGSGGGFPGIPLALCRPEMSVVLLESRHKKILFLKEVCRRLALGNVIFEEIRLENFYPSMPFDIVTVRALPGWEKFLKKVKSLVSADGRIIYYKKAGMIEFISP